MSLTLPTYFTLTRLLLGPVLMPLLILYVLPYNIGWVHYLVAGIFVCFSLTDFFDGFIARLYKQETVLGRWLDLLADKFLFCSIFLALVSIHRIHFIWAFIFIGRDIFMQGLRVFAQEYALTLPVAWWGKIKTIIIDLYIAVVLANPDYMKPYSASPFNQLERILLFAGVVSTLFAAYRYVRKLQKGINKKKQEQAHQGVAVVVVPAPAEDKPK